MNTSLENWLLTQAAYYLEYEQPHKSIALLEAISIVYPEKIEVYRMLSYAYLQVARHEESILAADRFLKHARPDQDVQALKWIKGRALLHRKKQ